MDAQQFAQLGQAFVTAFPGDCSSIEDQIAAGDQVATRATYRGTHQKETRSGTR